jgi:hypothetical protein
VRRVLDYLLRHLVRWLRRHRYTRTAGRIRALEVELGMVEPTISEMYANPALIGDTPRGRLPYALANASVYGGVVAISTDPAELRLMLLADHPSGVSQHATGHGRNYFANGNMTIGGTLPDFPLVPKLPPFTPDPRLTTRTSE